MGFYSRAIFPRFYDFLIDKPFWSEHRRQQLATVDGEILEIGIGTGLNLPHYPEHVKHIVTVDPNPGMNTRLQRRAEQSNIDIDQRLVGGEKLPFEDASFDFAVTTMTLCSIPDVNEAMSEVFRVLKPGGRLLFLEHGLSADEQVANWQRRLDWAQRRFAAGCTLTLDVAAVLATQPFAHVEMDTFYMEKTPKTHGCMYRGSARK